MKSLLTIFLFLGLLSTSFAQRNRITAGFYAGPNFTGTRGNYYEPLQAGHVGFCGGLSIQYNFPNVISIYSGIRYDQKKTDTDVRFLFDDYYITAYNRITHMHYIHIPLLIRAHFGKKDWFFVNTGGYINRFVGQNSRYILKEKFAIFHQIDHDYPEDPELITAQWDAGVSIGAGLQIPFTNKLQFCLELRNDLGLLNLAERVQSFESKTLKLNTCQLLVGFTYSFAERHVQSN